MFLVGVLRELLTFLFHHLSGHVANVALVGLVVSKSFVLFPQTTKGIEHNTLDDVSEQHAKECAVNHVVSEPANFKFLHCLGYGARHIQRHDTIQYVIAHFINSLAFSIDVLHVVAKGNSTEHKYEHDAHETDIEQRLDVDSNGFENVGQDLNFTEDFNQVDEECDRVVEGTNY